jgi:hypothetical protein
MGIQFGPLDEVSRTRLQAFILNARAWGQVQGP